jgi:hypothetical protein
MCILTTSSPSKTFAYGTEQPVREDGTEIGLFCLQNNHKRIQGVSVTVSLTKWRSPLGQVESSKCVILVVS